MLRPRARKKTAFRAGRLKSLDGFAEFPATVLAPFLVLLLLRRKASSNRAFLVSL